MLCVGEPGLHALGGEVPRHELGLGEVPQHQLGLGDPGAGLPQGGVEGLGVRVVVRVEEGNVVLLGLVGEVGVETGLHQVVQLLLAGLVLVHLEEDDLGRWRAG